MELKQYPIFPGINFTFNVESRSNSTYSTKIRGYEDSVDAFWDFLANRDYPEKAAQARNKLIWLLDHNLDFRIVAVTENGFVMSRFFESVTFWLVFPNPDHEVFYKLAWQDD